MTTETRIPQPAPASGVSFLSALRDHLPGFIAATEPLWYRDPRLGLLPVLGWLLDDEPFDDSTDTALCYWPLTPEGVVIDWRGKLVGSEDL